MERIRLLEDEHIEAMVLQRALSTASHSDCLIQAKDSAQALQFLHGENENVETQKPFMVLLDLKLSRMSGVELLENIRDDAELSDCIVFVLTTSASVNGQVDGGEHNIAGYIVKSIMADGYGKIGQLLEDYCELVTLPYKPH